MRDERREATWSERLRKPSASVRERSVKSSAGFKHATSRPAGSSAWELALTLATASIYATLPRRPWSTGNVLRTPVTFDLSAPRLLNQQINQEAKSQEGKQGNKQAGKLINTQKLTPFVLFLPSDGKSFQSFIWEKVSESIFRSQTRNEEERRRVWPRLLTPPTT